ncbi:MAG TPA: alkaline phosphatase D family protein [Thermoanaerobaculaceae bacterium]|nr:alkaline phosphatase D family protein [Thermoanaerobaculaceae bacterium]
METRKVLALGGAAWLALAGVAGARSSTARARLVRVPEITLETIRTELAPAVTSGAPIPGVAQGPQFFPQSVASGDPRPDSVVLWTRVTDPDAAGQDIPVRVIVTQDQFFSHVVLNQVFAAKAAYDNCLKVRIGGLAPRTTYYYFFVFYKGGVIYLSHLGRTKTAPAPTDATPVRFAYFSCQDYEGRFYNTYARLLLDHGDDLDFVAFIGDYIYETAGDPSSQTPIPGRAIDFTDKAGAIQLGSAQQPYWAAASLANYRQLYQTYRSDPALQNLHESFPMIATWDDHEYSNDCHGAVATYFDKRKDENDPERRRHAEQAFFEYMPISVGLGADGTLAIDDSILYPNAVIYQGFNFGANLDLMLTDYRSYRSDVLIPENAFPGAVVLDKPTLVEILGDSAYGAVEGSLDPYVAIDANPVVQATAVAILTQLYQASNPFLDAAGAAAAAAQAASGNVSATYLNSLFTGAGQPAPFAPADLAAMDRGLSYLFLGKLNLYDSQGSRYVVAKDGFDILSGYLWAATQGAAEDVYGATQEAWIKDTLSHSTAAWKVFTSSVSMTPMVLDFENPQIASFLPPSFPDAYRTRLLVDTEQWDGFPQRRDEIVSYLQGIPGTVIISGDIHGSFVSNHGNGLYEFTGAAVSSQTLEQEVLTIAQASPVLSQVAGLDQLVAAIGEILQLSSLDPNVSSAEIVDDWPGSHGCVVVTASPDTLTATYYHIDSSEIGTNYYADPAALNSLFTTTTFKVKGGALQEVGP